jgi:hypothetical protein
VTNGYYYILHIYFREKLESIVYSNERGVLLYFSTKENNSISVLGA